MARMSDAVTVLIKQQTNFLTRASERLNQSRPQSAPAPSTSGQRTGAAAPADRSGEARPSEPVKLYDVTKPRPKEVNELAVSTLEINSTAGHKLIDDQEFVRVHARELMGRDAWNSPFDEDLIPTAEEVEAFDPRKGPCCTVKKFRVDLNDSSGTVWNTSATNVFVKDFISAKVYPSASRYQVAKAFRTHLGRLRTVYSQLNSGGVSAKKQKALNSDERQRNVSATRRLSVLSLTVYGSSSGAV